MYPLNGSSKENSCKDVGEGLSPSSEEFKCNNYTDKLLHLIFGYKIMKKFTDVVLVAGEYRIFAHKMILTASSEYFSAMFTGSLKEANQDEITLEGVDGEALQSLVNYCYTGSIGLREDTVEILLSTASLLQLNEVVEACCSFLLKHIHPSNCLGIASFADQHSCKALQKEANEYINENFVEVSKHQEFLSLKIDQLTTFLLSDDLCVLSEDCVLDCIVSWINHDLTERQKYAQQMLELVKLPLLSQNYLLNQTKSTFGYIKEYNELIMDALRWQLLSDVQKQLSSNKITPRKSPLGKLLAVGNNNGNIVVNVYDPRINSWSVLTKLEFKKVEFGVAIIDERMFLIGGKDGNNVSSELQCLNMNTLKLTTYNSMQTPRRNFAVAVINNGQESTIFVIGGQGSGGSLNSAERWSSTTQSWSSISPMSQARQGCGAAVLGGNIYVVGGGFNDGYLNSVEMYCPSSDTWRTCKSMITKREWPGVVADGKYIYALGGVDGPYLASVERYDPETDTWSPLASLSRGRRSIGACLLGNKLIAAGGRGGGQWLQIVEEYDAQKDEWKPLKPLPMAMERVAVVCLKNWF